MNFYRLSIKVLLISILLINTISIAGSSEFSKSLSVDSLDHLDSIANNAAAAHSFNLFQQRSTDPNQFNINCRQALLNYYESATICLNSLIPSGRTTFSFDWLPEFGTGVNSGTNYQLNRVCAVDGCVANITSRAIRVRNICEQSGIILAPALRLNLAESIKNITTVSGILCLKSPAITGEFCADKIAALKTNLNALSAASRSGSNSMISLASASPTLFVSVCTDCLFSINRVLIAFNRPLFDVRFARLVCLRADDDNSFTNARAVDFCLPRLLTIFSNPASVWNRNASLTCSNCFQRFLGVANQLPNRTPAEITDTNTYYTEINRICSTRTADGRPCAEFLQDDVGIQNAILGVAQCLSGMAMPNQACPAACINNGIPALQRFSCCLPQVFTSQGFTTALANNNILLPTFRSYLTQRCGLTVAACTVTKRVAVRINFPNLAYDWANSAVARVAFIKDLSLNIGIAEVNINIIAITGIPSSDPNNQIRSTSVAFTITVSYDNQSIEIVRLLNHLFHRAQSQSASAADDGYVSVNRQSTANTDSDTEYVTPNLSSAADNDGNAAIAADSGFTASLSSAASESTPPQVSTGNSIIGSTMLVFSTVIVSILALLIL